MHGIEYSTHIPSNLTEQQGAAVTVRVMLSFALLFSGQNFVLQYSG